MRRAVTAFAKSIFFEPSREQRICLDVLKAAAHFYHTGTDLPKQLSHPVSKETQMRTNKYLFSHKSQNV